MRDSGRLCFLTSTSDSKQTLKTFTRNAGRKTTMTKKLNDNSAIIIVYSLPNYNNAIINVKNKNMTLTCDNVLPVNRWKHLHIKYKKTERWTDSKYYLHIFKESSNLKLNIESVHELLTTEYNTFSTKQTCRTITEALLQKQSCILFIFNSVWWPIINLHYA